jgi:hypothetical protein
VEVKKETGMTVVCEEGEESKDWKNIKITNPARVNP